VKKRPREERAYSESLLHTARETYQAWLRSIPQTTLAWFHENQPDDPEDQDAYEAWEETGFALEVGNSFEQAAIAWTEQTTDQEKLDFYDVRTYDRHGQEYALGTFPGDTKVYALGL
jgi:hypothetical protein